MSRPSARIGAMLLALLSADAAARLLPARFCRRQCAAVIADCVVDTGWTVRRCRRKLAALAVRCRRRGPGICVSAYPPPTTTTTTSTSTTSTTAPFLTVPLTGCASSGYVAPVTIGAQTFELLTDSGSTTLGVASTACQSAECSSLSPRYSPAGTAANLGTTATSTYGDGSSWSGRIFSDLVSLAGPAATVRVAFSTIDVARGFFRPAACNFVDVPNASQGILGLGGTALAVAGTGSYIDTLALAGELGDAFAVRLCGSGGTLWLGGYDAAAATTPPSYTPMVPGSRYYSLTLSDVRLGGTTLGFSPVAYGATLVDIGTTALLLPPAPFSALANAVATIPLFAENFGDASWFNALQCNSLTGGLTKADLDRALPALTLAFPSSTGATFTVDLPATESYLLQQNDALGTAYYCPGIEPANGLPTIIGANALHTLLAVVDRRNGLIGFAPGQGCAPLAEAARVESSRPGPATRPAPPYRRLVF